MKITFIFTFICIAIASCKPSDKYSTDTLYPIPNYPTTPNMNEISNELKVQDSSIQPFVDEFNSYIQTYGTTKLNKGIYYTFDDLSSLPGHILGKCTPYKNDNIVTIDSTFWASASEWDKRSVIFHELGHCELGRGHRTLYFEGPNLYYDGGYKPAWPIVSHYLSDGITVNPNYRGDWPLSLMHRAIVRQAKFQTESSYYITELFTDDRVSFVDTSFEDAYLKSDCHARYELDGNIHYY